MAISVVAVTVIAAEVFGYGLGVAVVAVGAAVHGKLWLVSGSEALR